MSAVSLPASVAVALPAGGVQVPLADESPADPWATLVIAHGAGAGMAHPFMAALAAGLAQRHIATLRYQFPFMERGSKRPDTPKVAHAAVRAAVREAARRWPGPRRLRSWPVRGRLPSEHPARG